MATSAAAASTASEIDAQLGSRVSLLVDHTANAEKITALRKETTEKIVAVLTDDQKKSWKEMTGEAFTFPPPTFGRPVPKKDD